MCITRRDEKRADGAADVRLSALTIPEAGCVNFRRNQSKLPSPRDQRAIAAALLSLVQRAEEDYPRARRAKFPGLPLPLPRRHRSMPEYTKEADKTITRRELNIGNRRRLEREIRSSRSHVRELRKLRLSPERLSALFRVPIPFPDFSARFRQPTTIPDLFCRTFN